MISQCKVAILLTLLFVAQTKMLVAHSPSVESQYVPIPKRYPGIDLPGSNPAVTIEVVSDAACGSCVQFDKVMRQVQASLQKSNPGRFSYRYALQVLPYHIASFKLTQAIKYVNDKQGPAAAFSLLRHFFDTNEKWDESGVVKSSIATLMNNIAKEVSTVTGLSTEQVRAEVAHFSKTDSETRKWVKYAMGTLHVSGTPTVFVNGARLDGATGLTAQQLIDLLTGLL